MSKALKILVAVDGSVSSLRAVQHVVDLAQRGLAVELHLLNVQPPVRGAATILLPRGELADYHREEGMKALADAVQALKVVGIAHHLHVAVGAPAQTVLAFVQRLACAMVVMGTRGYGGGVAGAVMGSVASDVVIRAAVPVTLLNSD
ncbi:MAG: universal stress protein [Acetobacteraceae bacterium]|nr:universal stress protein [Acetobacteraceae bacterium]